MSRIEAPNQRYCDNFFIHFHVRVPEPRAIRLVVLLSEGHGMLLQPMSIHHKIRHMISNAISCTLNHIINYVSNYMINFKGTATPIGLKF